MLKPVQRQTNSPVSTECSKLSCHSSNRSRWDSHLVARTLGVGKSRHQLTAVIEIRLVYFWQFANRIYSASTNPDWSPKVPSLRSQRNRLRMRSRDNSPSADLSSVIDSKYLAFSQTLGSSIPPKPELRGRSNSISEETVNIATKVWELPIAATTHQGKGQKLSPTCMYSGRIS